MKIPDSVDKLMGGQSVKDMFDEVLSDGADCAVVVYEVDGEAYCATTEMKLSKVVFLLESAKATAFGGD